MYLCLSGRANLNLSLLWLLKVPGCPAKTFVLRGLDELVLCAGQLWEVGLFLGRALIYPPSFLCICEGS